MSLLVHGGGFIEFGGSGTSKNIIVSVCLMGLNRMYSSEM
jgi:hypothetical protein